MSFPTAFFIDTSIFDGQHYNFESTAFASFTKVVCERELVYLLPEVTENEIKRHIESRISDVLQVQDKIRRNAPFLSSWKHFPPDQNRAVVKFQMIDEANRSIKSFLSKFNVKRLGYYGLDLKVIMSWYDNSISPFGEGNKRKEFPDAIVVAMLEKYARENQSMIAVVSQDKDFQLACERFSSLLYFKSLPELTQHLLSDSSVFDSIHNAICDDLSLVENALNDEAASVDFSHYDRNYSIRRTHLHNIEISGVFIIGLGFNECTFTFSASLEAEHLIEWQEYDRDGEFDSNEEWVLDAYSQLTDH